MDEHKSFDVAVIGGGIGGTILATILARNGVRVVCLEGGSHPRFAIGEATVPDSTLGMRVLASRYDVPELLNLSNYRSMRRHVATTCGVKRSFSFVYHRPGQSNHPQECTQFPTFAPPIGPDMHYFRQDVDAYLFSLAVSYGAVCHTETRITNVEFDDDGVRLTAAGNGQEGRSFHAQYVVDAGGPGALLPRLLGLREEPCPYETRSRAIFTHMVGVPPYERMGPEFRAHGMATPLSQGTLHHIFQGGWMWIIPFGNHPLSTNRLCSVGLVLELAEFPEQELAPEEEFWSIVRRFPGIFRHLRDAIPVRNWVRTSRLQFSSTRVVGDRFCLLPHASDFVDPFFSSGLTNTAMAVNVLAPRLIKATRNKDFATESFEYVDTWVKRVFAYYDQLVTCSYIAFRDFELWNAWHRVWMVVSVYSGNSMIQTLVRFEGHRDPAVFEQLEHYPYRGLQAIDYPPCWKLFTSAVTEMKGSSLRRVALRTGGQSRLSPGRLPAAAIHFSTAARLGTAVRHQHLICWSLGAQSMNAYTQRRHPEALDLARQAGEYADTPLRCAQILAWGELRALAAFGDARRSEAEDVMAAAQDQMAADPHGDQPRCPASSRPTAPAPNPTAVALRNPPPVPGSSETEPHRC